MRYIGSGLEHFLRLTAMPYFPIFFTLKIRGTVVGWVNAFSEMLLKRCRSTPQCGTATTSSTPSRRWPLSSYHIRPSSSRRDSERTGTTTPAALEDFYRHVCHDRAHVPKKGSFNLWSSYDLFSKAQENVTKTKAFEAWPCFICPHLIILTSIYIFQLCYSTGRW